MSEAPAIPPSLAVDTHISSVMFVGDRAYKLLKPVATAFLDHSDIERRARAVTAELELNRRLAPDVYLGTADVIENGSLADRMLVMRRLPHERRLSALTDDTDFADHLRRVARAIAAFHAGQPAIHDPVPMSTADGLAALWGSSFDDLAAAAGPVIEPAEFESVQRLALDYLGHGGPLFDARREAGHIRDGHGDLIADDIFMLDDGPRMLDCLAFHDDYRISDVLADIAFLVMDVERLAGPVAARELMHRYCEFSGEHHPASLAHHYVAYRAHVRCKVATMQHRQGRTDAAELARRLHRQTHDHLVRAQLRVVLVGGGPGSGKSTTANAIAERLNWAVVDTDTLRKDLHHIAHDDHDVDSHPELYDAAATAKTYEHLTRHATQLIRSGICVVMDATWADAAHRRRIRQVAHENGATIHEFGCEAPESIARQRVDERRSDNLDVSDATPTLVSSFTCDPWPEALRLDTTSRADDVVDRAVQEMFGRPAPATFQTGVVTP